MTTGVIARSIGATIATTDVRIGPNGTSARKDQTDRTALSDPIGPTVPIDLTVPIGLTVRGDLTVPSDRTGRGVLSARVEASRS